MGSFYIIIQFFLVNKIMKAFIAVFLLSASPSVPTFFESITSYGPYRLDGVYGVYEDVVYIMQTMNG